MTDVIRTYSEDSAMEDFMKTMPELECWNAVRILNELVSCRWHGRTRGGPSQQMKDRLKKAEALYAERFGEWLPF